MLRLLIVDDEVIVRKWLTLVFQPFDKEFVVFGTGTKCKEKR